MNPLLLSGLQNSRLMEPLQLFYGLIHPPVRRRYVELNGLPSCPGITAVPHDGRGLQHCILFDLSRFIAQLKFCIGQTVSESIRRFHLFPVKISVPDINSFSVFFIVHIAIMIGKCRGCWII